MNTHKSVKIEFYEPELLAIDMGLELVCNSYSLLYKASFSQEQRDSMDEAMRSLSRKIKDALSSVK